MCGRYTLTEDVEQIADVFEADVEPIRHVHEPRYNIAPTQDAPVVIAGREGRRVGLLRWGLVPHWADELSVGARMINARVESVSTRPAFRDSFLRKRCLVPADGFYEWEDRGSRKQPHWVHARRESLFGFAGLWASWTAPNEIQYHTYCILTRPAPAELAWLHDRVPLILPKEDWTDWLARGTAPEVLQEVLERAEPPALQTHPVSTRVNKAGYEEPDCTDEIDLDDFPVEEQTSLF